MCLFRTRARARERESERESGRERVRETREKEEAGWMERGREGEIDRER